MLPIIVQASNINTTICDRNMRLLGGEPQIIYLLNRLKKNLNTQIVLATTSDVIDDGLEFIANNLGIVSFRGTFYDILSRLLGASERLGCDNFIRVCGNYPLVDIDAISKLQEEHVSGKYDYSYNEHRYGVIWGTGCDIFNVDVLKKLDDRLTDKYQREAVAFYLQQNADMFKIHKSVFRQSRPQYKVSFETDKDLRVIQEIVKNVPQITNENIIQYLDNHEIIAQYNMENPAKEIGTEKLFLHTAKIQDILDNHTVANTYPISVELTLTNACNLKCVYCSDQELRKKQGCHNMEFETFERLFKDLADGGTKGVVFEGGGEPTIHPDFSKLVYCARENGLAVGLITNGTMELDDDVLHQFEWIRVSLDASNAEEYFRLKKVDCFEKALSNIGNYAKNCDTVGVGYIVTNQNMSNIETLILRLRELRVSYIQLRPVVDHPELLPDEKDLHYLEFYRNRSFNVIVDGMSENMERGNNALPCYASSITSIISGAGDVFICGRLNIYNWIQPIGNIQTQSFNEIWNGEERKKQLSMISNSDFCKNNCPQCRVSKYNKLFNRLIQTKSVHFI